MSEEEQRDYNQFSPVSVSRSTSKRPWKAQGDSKDSESQDKDNSIVRQARPQAVAKAQSVKSTNSDHRSVQLRPVQDQPARQAQFPVLAPQGQGHRLGRPIVVRHDDLDSLSSMKLCLKKNSLVQRFWTKLPNFVILKG